MAKKIVLVAFALIVLCLCCGTCFAAENSNSSINLGNEIMQSIDKTGQSMENVVSGNVIRDTGNDMKNGAENMGRDGMGAINNGNYNVARTTTEGTVSDANNTAMNTTTWMWIILVVAAIVIIAAIWYYATRGNE